MVPDRALDPEAFRALIAMHGVVVRWWRSRTCPCRNPEAGEFSRTCPLLVAGTCDGAWVYEEQTVPAAARVYFDRAKKTVEDSELGLIQVGDLMAYAMTDEVPFERPDRLLLTEWWLDAKETIKHDSDDVLSQPHGFALDSVKWLNAQNTLITSTIGAGGDVTMTTGNDGTSRLVWRSGGTKPPNGTNVSVLYRYRPMVYVNGVSFMPARMASGMGNSSTRYGLPVRGLMTLKKPQEDA